MGQILWVLICGDCLWCLKTVFGWNLMDVEIFHRICGDCFWDFDLRRLFAGVVVDADHVQFLLLEKYQGRKKQRGGYFDSEFVCLFVC